MAALLGARNTPGIPSSSRLALTAFSALAAFTTGCEPSRARARLARSIPWFTRGRYAVRVVALFACPRCNAHVKAFERRCPHCGHGLPTDGSTFALTATALLLGLSMSGCGSNTPIPETIYGAAPADDNDDKKGEPDPAKQPDTKKPAVKKPDPKSEPSR